MCIAKGIIAVAYKLDSLSAPSGIPTKTVKTPRFVSTPTKVEMVCWGVCA